MSYGIADSRSATSRTWFAGTNRKVGSLSMNRLISQGHAIRSTRARSRVTHFMRSPSVTWCRLSCRAILSVRRFRRRDEMALNAVYGVAPGRRRSGLEFAESLVQRCRASRIRVSLTYERFLEILLDHCDLLRSSPAGPVSVVRHSDADATFETSGSREARQRSST